MGSYESQLRSGGVPSGEISIIVHNLEKLEGAGLSLRSIGDVVSKVIKDSRFRASFVKDYRIAMR